MESITLFVSIVIAVFGILQIILFFKIWGMTNDVAELNRIIKEHLSKQVNSNTFISAIGDNLPMLADEIHHQTGNLAHSFTHNNLTPSIILLCINSIFICAMMEETSAENIFSYKGDYYV